jgi:L-threonylcarbamoyladenylate synthase
LITTLIEQINNNKSILYPTDTIWGIGCDATNFDAVRKIYQLKQREEAKSLIILVDSFEMLKNYVESVPLEVKLFLKKQTRPTTVIYENPKNLAKNVVAKDNTIAIRIVKNGFVAELIKAFGKPIVSTSANISGEETPLSFDEISKEIKNGVDYIVNHKQNKKEAKSSKIIRFVDNKIVILRD